MYLFCNRKLEEQVGQQEIKLLGKIKNSDENNRMDLDDSVRLLQVLYFTSKRLPNFTKINFRMK